MTDIYTDILGYARGVCEEIGESSDSQSAIWCIDAARELDRLIAAARTARTLLDTQIIRKLEQPAQRDGFVWFVQDDYQERWDHDWIADRIARRASYDEDGVLREDVKAAVREAVDNVMRLYVSPSTSAKKGVAKDLKVDEALERKKRGKKVTHNQVEES